MARFCLLSSRGPEEFDPLTFSVSLRHAPNCTIGPLRSAWLCYHNAWGAVSCLLGTANLMPMPIVGIHNDLAGPRRFPAGEAAGRADADHRIPSLMVFGRDYVAQMRTKCAIRERACASLTCLAPIRTMAAAREKGALGND